MNSVDIIGKDEKVLEVVQKHWINVVPLMSGFLVISAAAVLGLYLVVHHTSSVRQVGSPAVAVVGLVALLALGIILAYISWIVYIENRLIITTQNLYKVTKRSLVSQSIAQLALERLQDVSATQNGLLASLCRFGNVTVETAGEEENFIFRQVPAPHALASRIMAYHRRVVADLPNRYQSVD